MMPVTGPEVCTECGTPLVSTAGQFVTKIIQFAPDDQAYCDDCFTPEGVDRSSAEPAPVPL